jgi:anti-sigma-K factor RskA
VADAEPAVWNSPASWVAAAAALATVAVPTCVLPLVEY